MKKLAMIAILASLSTSAMALGLGVRGTVAGGDNDNAIGLTVGQEFGVYGVEAAIDRTTQNDAKINRWSLAGTYNLVKVGDFGFIPKAGVAYVDHQGPGQDDGWAPFVGVGVDYQLTQTVSLTADYVYQIDQHDTRSENGNRVTIGAKYLF